ncbi:MAG: hypothetical protein J0M02_05670 [Planctomycetes bacterium]|nr:hypothetical protein [Planctomycetota bacterium]
MSPSCPPIRPVLRWLTPDPRHPWFKDYVLSCGHRLVHRPLRRGSDGRMHVARRLACPHCHAL